MIESVRRKRILFFLFFLFVLSIVVNLPPTPAVACSRLGAILEGTAKVLGDPEFRQNLDDMSRLSGSNQNNFDENLALSHYHSAQTPEDRAFWHERYLQLKEERLDREREMRYLDREMREDMRHRELLDAIKRY